MWLTHLSPLLQSAYKFMRWGEKSISLGVEKLTPHSHFPMFRKIKSGNVALVFPYYYVFGIYKWYKNNPCRKNALTIEKQIYSVTNQFIMLFIISSCFRL